MSLGTSEGILSKADLIFRHENVAGSTLLLPFKQEHTICCHSGR